MLRSTARLIVSLVALILAGSTVVYGADADTVTAVTASTTSAAPASLASLPTLDLSAAIAQPTMTLAEVRKPAVGSKALRLGLYASFAALQALDAHSTLKAIRAGGHEANPVMAGIARQPIGLIAVKAGTAAGTIMLVEKLSKGNPIASMIVMTALNSAYATVVAHNYRIANGR